LAEKFSRPAEIIMTYTGDEKLTEDELLEVALQVEMELNGIGAFNNGFIQLRDKKKNKLVKVCVRVHMK